MAGEFSAALRRRPPESTLRWAAAAVGECSRIVSIRRLTLGGWHANHALTILDRRGRRHRLVLRRWARPEWVVEDPDFTAAREAAALELLAGSSVPAPRLVAGDFEARVCDVPTLLITRLPGHPPGLPVDMSSFLVQLAEVLPPIHAIDDRSRAHIGDYRPYSDLRAASPPAWSSRQELWTQALELARADPPPGPRCFIHRDYHPENTLWSRGRLTAIVDWTSVSWGSPAVDVAHMRWNLALTYGPDAADEFLRLHRSLAGGFDHQQRWDVVTLVDVFVDLDPREWSRFDLERLERYLESVLSRE